MQASPVSSPISADPAPLHEVAAALARVRVVLERRPEVGLSADAPATARWRGGTRVVTSHANGTQIATDMPREVGGSGDCVTPGWMFRAGLASCAATSIALTAASDGIELTLLEAHVTSVSDARALVGLNGADGQPVYGGPTEMQLQVRIAARGVPAQRLQTLVENALSRSPIPCAVRNATPLSLTIDVDAA